MPEKPGRRLEQVAEDAVDRAGRGNTVFVPFTPSMTSEAIAAAVDICAGRHSIEVAITVTPDGILVSRAGAEP
jgi:hypothetical protein